VSRNDGDSGTDTDNGSGEEAGNDHASDWDSLRINHDSIITV